MKKSDFLNIVKLSKKKLILITIFIFLVGGIFHRFSLFPFNILSNIKDYLFKNKFEETSMVSNVKNKTRKLKKYSFLKNINLHSLYPEEVLINKEKKELKIYSKIENNFFIISGIGNKEKTLSTLKNWQITFENLNTQTGSSNLISGNYFSKYGVRGCLNIYDLNLIDINFSVKNCNLENALELLSVKGTIDKISIDSSKFDGLDIKYAMLKVNHTIIQNSKNDCIDLNSGNYQFKNVVVYNCNNPIDSEASYTNFENLKIFSREQKNEFKKYKIF